MEVYTPPPYREARPTGRPQKLTYETQLLVAAKVTSKEMTFREAAKAFGVSTAAISRCVKIAAKEKLNTRTNKRIKSCSEEAEAYRHQAQIKDLKQVIGDLYIENQMLKKILNKSLLIKKFNGSVITTDNLDQLQRDAE